jgi:hypothetical protein
MKKHIWLLCLAANLVMLGCKGNGSTSGDSNDGKSDSVSLNDGTGAPGSGTGSAGSGTVGDTTRTQQDTAKGAPMPKKGDTTSR